MEAEELKILDVNIYRDGGTIVVETNNGKYWLPHGSIAMYKGDNYFRGVFELIDNEDEISVIVKALARHSATYMWIVRHIKHDLLAEQRYQSSANQSSDDKVPPS